MHRAHVYWIAGCIVALLSGVFIGYLIFRMPQFACGSLQSDIAAQWLAAVGGLLAAAATIWAVLVAIANSNRTLKVARDTLSLAQTTRLKDDMAGRLKTNAMRLRFSTIFMAELYVVGSQLAMLSEDLVKAYGRADPVEIRRLMMAGMPRQGLKLIDKFSDDFLVFPAEAGSLLAIALWRWSALEGSPRIDGGPEFRILEAADALRRAIDATVADFRAAASALRKYSPKYALESRDKEAFIDVTRDYVAERF